MERLGVGEGEATRLMDLLVEVAATEGSYLALAEGEDGRSVTLAYGGGTHGRQVRLTRGETFALLAAMGALRRAPGAPPAGGCVVPRRLGPRPRRGPRLQARSHGAGSGRRSGPGRPGRAGRT